MRISDWSSDVCSSDLSAVLGTALVIVLANWAIVSGQMGKPMGLLPWESMFYLGPDFIWTLTLLANDQVDFAWRGAALVRSEEHTSELQSLMRISYAVFCLKKKNKYKSNSGMMIDMTTNKKNTLVL